MHTHFCLLCNKEFVRRNKELKLDKQFCGVKCSKSLDGLKLLYSDEEALKIRENYLDSKRQSEEKFIKKYGEELGKEKWKNYNSSKGSTKESMIKKYGEIEGNIRWNSYIEKV